MTEQDLFILLVFVSIVGGADALLNHLERKMLKNEQGRGKTDKS